MGYYLNSIIQAAIVFTINVVVAIKFHSVSYGKCGIACILTVIHLELYAHKELASFVVGLKENRGGFIAIVVNAIPMTMLRIAFVAIGIVIVAPIYFILPYQGITIFATTVSIPVKAVITNAMIFLVSVARLIIEIFVTFIAAVVIAEAVVADVYVTVVGMHTT